MLAFLPILLLAAQGTTPAVPAAAPEQRGRPHVFIAPSGEPFRTYGDEPYPVSQWFAGADRNADGKLDFAEFDADFLRFFDTLDGNQDGVIDSGEKVRYETVVAPETNGGTVRGNAERDMQFDQNTGQWQDASGSAMGSNQDKIFLNKKKRDRMLLGAARYDLLELPEPVAAMDVRIRGRISQSDAHDAARLRFRQLDPQNRGYLVLGELPRTYAQDGGR